MKEKSFPIGLPPGSVAASASGVDSDLEFPTVAPESGIAVTVLLHLSPLRASRSTIPPEEREALIAILQGIAREPRIGSVSVTAFNIDRARVIFQQDNVRQAHLADLRKAIDSLALGTIDAAQLGEKDAGAKFLVRLAAQEAQRSRPDALIFAGPRTLDEAGMTRDMLKELGEVPFPVFYLTYSPAADPNPWRDVIGSAVRHWRGREFSIAKPLDLASAWSKIMTELAHTSSFAGPER